MIANTALNSMGQTHSGCQKMVLSSEQSSAESTRDLRDSQEEKQLTLPDAKLFPDPFGSRMFGRGS